MMDHFISGIVTAVVVALIMDYRAYRQRQQWATMVRGVIKMVNAQHDKGKPFRITELKFDGITIIDEDEHGKTLQ